ncbi:MAG: PilZ domain-containing protein [Candidatus Nitrospinota bacterium M3_3B_026]
MDERKGEGQTPVVYIYTTATLHLKCPSCGAESTVALKKPLTQSAKVTCNRCRTLFIVQPTEREQYRKPLDTYADMDRKPIGEPKKRSVIEVKATDISRGGMGIIIPRNGMSGHSFEVEEMVHLRFALPKKSKEVTVNVKAVIRNLIPIGGSGASKAGLEFSDLDEHATKEIGFFLWN